VLQNGVDGLSTGANIRAIHASAAAAHRHSRMIQRMEAPITVLAVFDHRTRQVVIRRITFDGCEHTITRTGMHYTQKSGRTLEHVYCVVSKEGAFKIVLNTETLHWTLQEVQSRDEYDLPPVQPEAGDRDAY
jgi:hypothetical protein